MPVSDIKTGHIDDVQELRKSKSSYVPERFIRDMKERPKFDKDIVSSTNNIPVVDLSKLFKGNKDEFLNEILKLTVSCQEWGFFQVLDLTDRVVSLNIFLIFTIGCCLAFTGGSP